MYGSIVTDTKTYEHGKWRREGEYMIIETRSPYAIEHFPKPFSYNYFRLYHIATYYNAAYTEKTDVIKVKVIGWDTEIIQYDSLFEQSNCVKFSNGKVIQDTHGQWNATKNEFIACMSSNIIFDLIINSKTKATLHRNFSNTPRILETDGNNKLTGRVHAHAGDRFIISQGSIESGIISVAPHYSYTAISDKNVKTLNIEYDGNLIKVNKAGHYKVSTVNGKLIVEEINNETK